MEEIIQVQDQFYILATSSRVDEHSRVLKHGDTFAVFDRMGNIQRVGLGEQGLYHEGTRFLSRVDLRILGRRPLLLSSTVREDNAMLTVDLTNPDIFKEGQIIVPRDQIHIYRCSFLWNGACYERVRLRNFSLSPADVSLELLFDADFADIFEVRGVKRARRGEVLPADIQAAAVRLSYRGLDAGLRRTTLRFSPPPRAVSAGRAEFHDVLPPHGEKAYYCTIECEVPDGRGAFDDHDAALAGLAEEMRQFRASGALVETSNEQFNEWLNRSAVDLELMVTHTESGPYPYAGVPWFSTVFGRDGILTALEYLWINPSLARGVLSFLAATQATTTEPARDAEPGKILHELRRGEMAALGEIPFQRYYGTVDATPLFVVLAGAYYERTADLAFIRGLWPHVEAALRWIDGPGDADGDGFVEYRRSTGQGLAVQGWKDSMESVFHADGALAEGPVALVEVQAYVYAARRAAARLARALGQPERADLLIQQAEQLRVRFEEAFWIDSLSTYALALDGRKQPCRVTTSNPGHCLFAGIVDPARAARVADVLMGEAMYSGWGIRTVAAHEARYNPMAYHNGSVWPHDNALAAAGFARYRLAEPVLRVLTGLFDASLFVDLHRMPELFCGFVRRPGEGPTLYPVACAPQSWAAGATFSLLQSALGLSFDAPNRRLRFAHAVLPKSLQRLRITQLQIGEARVDLAVERFPRDVGIELLHRDGQVEIEAVK